MVKRSHQSLSDGERLRLQEEMKSKESRMHAAHVAYLNRLPFEGTIPQYEDLKATAQDFISANYAYQKALYGRIMVKLSAAKLLR